MLPLDTIPQDIILSFFLEYPSLESYERLTDKLHAVDLLMEKITVSEAEDFRAEIALFLFNIGFDIDMDRVLIAAARLKKRDLYNEIRPYATDETAIACASFLIGDLIVIKENIDIRALASVALEMADERLFLLTTGRGINEMDYLIYSVKDEKSLNLLLKYFSKVAFEHPNELVKAAVRANNTEIIDTIIDLFPREKKSTLIIAAEEAALECKYSYLKSILSDIPRTKRMISNAILSRDNRIKDLVITETRSYRNVIASYAAATGDFQLLKRAIESGATNFTKIASVACSNRILSYIRSKGKININKVRESQHRLKNNHINI